MHACILDDQYLKKRVTKPSIIEKDSVSYLLNYDDIDINYNTFIFYKLR